MKTPKNYHIPKSIFKEIKTHLNQKSDRKIDVKDDKEIAGWFMGTRGENLGEVFQIITGVMKTMIEGRELLFPDDPNYITAKIKTSEAYKKAIGDVKEQTNNLLEILKKYSLPMYSLRYQGHMTWDVTLPSLVGYIAAIFENQNNVTPQASPATTILELLVCNDIARMAGFKVKPLDDDGPDSGINAWAHISCDGSVANIESLWAARELKFLPLGIKYALRANEYLAEIESEFFLHDDVKFSKVSAWELLNLKQDDILELPRKIAELKFGVDYSEKELAEVWKQLTSKYSLNARGIQFFYVEYFQIEDINMPAIIVPSTKHYSWPKAASVLGMGNGRKGLAEQELVDIKSIKDDGLINVYVDPDGRVKTDLLNKVLQTCKANKKPVIMVVGVMGTTEEGAVDPLEMIIETREDFRKDIKNPFEYSIHADAAWGGYFLSCFRNEFKMEDFPTEKAASRMANPEVFDNKDSWFKDSVYTSMTSICKCDSVTIDPHKMGYIPYPAGSLTYRNDKIINLLSFSAPYISSGAEPEKGINTRNIGECGIEGSKAGAAAASVYLSHMVIRPDKSGYGKIINQSMLNSKLFYLYLYSLKWLEPHDLFEIVMFDEFSLKNTKSGLTQKTLVDLLWKKRLELGELIKDKRIQTLLKEIAGDQNLIDYIFIDKREHDLVRTKDLNDEIFTKLSLAPGVTVKDDDIFVSETTFHRNEYGNDFMNALAKRIYVKDPEKAEAIPCIRSVIMDPWAIYTHGENKFNFFIDVFIPKLREVVNKNCEDYAKKEKEKIIADNANK
ncbi:MAG: hypothetical protein JEZ03_06010 [Bacteroidales bacterium]|nr:hypothetical protein [Bacteroidales bacterium]